MILVTHIFQIFSSAKEFKLVRDVGARFWLSLATAILASGCAEIQFLSHAAKEVSTKPTSPPNQSTDGAPNGSHYKIGKPYQIKGVWYYPQADYDYSEEGIASWYGPNFHGKPTANGAVFDMNKVSAAHRTLPLPSMVQVTNLENGRSMRVKVNDRGPFAKGRIIDLSRRAAQLLGFERQGTALVRVEIIEDESRRLAAYFQNNGRIPAGEPQPPKPDAAPTVTVSGADLAPPNGVIASNSKQGSAVESGPGSTQENALIERARASSETLPDSDTAARVSSVLEGHEIFVQAGAFGEFHNAQRAQALLGSLGPIEVQQIMTSDVPLFRIRVGPVASASEADLLLRSIQAAGYGDARIVVVN